MSYREENGQVVLTMSREDYELLLVSLGAAVGSLLVNRFEATATATVQLTNRLNEGNPNYTPYEVASAKS